MKKLSLILPCFFRAKLLNLSLWSIVQQKIKYDLEIVVLNDCIKDNTEEICSKYKDKLNIKYIFTGQRNENSFIHTRIPGFAINIGVKQCKGEIIILSSPEVFHLNNSINLIVEPLLKIKRLLLKV